MAVFKPQVTVRDLILTPALNDLIRRRIMKLDRFFDRIIGCRANVEFIQKHKHQGKLYKIKLHLTVPGKEIDINRQSNEDIYIAIRDAFKALERKLENHARKCQGRVKFHTDVMHGFVSRMIREEGYGFIEGIDGNEYYFSMTSVSYPDFNQIIVGDAVEYIPTTLSEGRQAQHVIRERSRHMDLPMTG